MKKTTLVLIFALLGAGLAGWYAQRNRTADGHTYQALYASMVNPPETLTSPRTYNQTLVETTDPAVLANLAQANGVSGINGVRYDVLPDSYHIQVTVNVSGAITEATKTALRQTVNDYLVERTDTLATALFAPETTIRPQVVFTKELPVQTNLGGNPTVAMLYGLVAGALFGWFIGLSTKK